MEKSRKESIKTSSARVGPEADEIRIALPERFIFHSNREFRAGYSTGQTAARRYAVDFAQTRFIDSAGLGMLLQLVEHANNDPQRVLLVNCTPEIRELLVVAGFDQAATII